MGKSSEEIALIKAKNVKCGRQTDKARKIAIEILCRSSNYHHTHLKNVKFKDALWLLIAEILFYSIILLGWKKVELCNLTF